VGKCLRGEQGEAGGYTFTWMTMDEFCQQQKQLLEVS